MLEGVTGTPDSSSVSTLLERYNLFVIIDLDLQVMHVWGEKEEGLAYLTLYLYLKKLNDLYILFIIKVYFLFQSKQVSSGGDIFNNSSVL